MKTPVVDHFQSTIKRAKQKRLFGLGVLVVLIAVCAFAFVVKTKSNAYQEQVETQYAVLDNELRLQVEPQLELAPRFAAFAQQYPSEPDGWQAALTAVQIWTLANPNLGAPDLGAMAAVLNTVLPYTNKAPIVRTKVQMALAGVQARENKLPEALATLDTALSELAADHPIAHQVKFMKAQILVAAGQKTEAIELLKDIQKALATAGMPSNSAAPADAALGQQINVWLGFLENS